jgi:DNA-binding MarR family transcriptional regulator
VKESVKREACQEQGILRTVRAFDHVNVFLLFHCWRPPDCTGGSLPSNVYEYLDFVGWDYVIRFRGKNKVTSQAGTTRTARGWVGSNGRPKMLPDATVTEKRFKVPAVVVVWDKKMKEPWCLATSLSDCSARTVVKNYGRRFSIEETFRDHKDPHFGMGLSATHIGSSDRRDRLLLLGAIAHALLTQLGAVAERAGLDRLLKVKTVKRRTHSLYRQGLYWYHAIPNTRKEWLVPLLKAFDEVIREHANLCEILGVI